nr:DsbA family oxidoreductase [uncultured Flavobacterium sp.]
MKNNDTKLIELEIWSDFMCPFCYIGKTKFENALENFEFKDQVQITWRSYQLDPNLYSNKYRNINEYIASTKQIPHEEAEQINNYVKSLGEKLDLVFNFDDMQVTNTLKAHQLSHLAKKYNKQNLIEGLLFKAQFEEGKNIDALPDLLVLAKKAEIPEEEVTKTIEQNLFISEIAKDIQASKDIGLTGVPFFVFNNKYGISGAQESETFLESLEKIYRDRKIQEAKAANQCSTDGFCE